MAETPAAAVVALPDDAVREILVRVADDAAFFRCATTCKRWRVLVADPHFLRRRWPKDAPSSSSTLFGFFAPRQRGGEPGFVPAPRSPINVVSCCSNRLSGPAGILDGSEPVASRHGLLLLRLRQDISTRGIHLGVCDPLMGTCDVLPPLRVGATFKTTSYAILTSADCCSTTGLVQISPLPALFKVLVVIRYIDIWCADRTSGEYGLHVFSFDGSRWTAAPDCSNHQGIGNPAAQGGAVVCGGMAYWLFKSTWSYYILEVSTDAGHVSSAKLSIQLDRFGIPSCLGVAVDGTLSLFCLRPECDQVEKWTRQGGYGSAEWICTRVIEVERPKRKQDQIALSIYVRERSATLLFISSSGVHIADLETGTTEDITAQFYGLVRWACVPFEADWAAFFSSRLGGRDQQSFPCAIDEF